MTKSIRVDATPFVRPYTDGVGRYSIELLKSLSQLKDFNYIFVGFLDDDFSQIKTFFPNSKIVRLPFLRRIWTLIYKTFPKFISAYETKQPFLYTNFAQFPYFSENGYVVIHDLAYIDRPREVSEKNRLYLSKVVPLSTYKAKKVICVSEYTKSRVIEVLSVDKNKVEVVENAVNRDFFQNKTKILKWKSETLPQDYILVLGTIEPRKNLLNILIAFDKLPHKLTSKHPLLIVGKLGWNNSEIINKIDELRSNNKPVLCTGYMPDHLLPSIYSNAKLLLFPSLYEGFGLPVIEAQLSKTPVITSNIEPMKSLATKKASILVDPFKTEEITKAIELILNNKELREELISSGWENAKKYSWKESARKLSNLLSP
ncbi:TPA: glycosyltransferase family 1 protein [Candidatus Saccharibacteria bacterium]|nr:glycosyltransferase family 1 protein [Candidatus Saccharibacteria bacterium]HIO87847.1 glycosyltransferase family 1 protein [Candidatus Saccharibacteria bacterium]